MLMLNDRPFATGSTQFLDDLPDESLKESRIVLPIRVGNSAENRFAIVDTGCPWCILQWAIAKEVGLPLGEGTHVAMNTRFGRMEGELHRLPITLLAEEGKSLSIEATVFVCEYWPGANFIGYNGYLERIRFAVDAFSNRFYFGQSDWEGE